MGPRDNIIRLESSQSARVQVAKGCLTVSQGPLHLVDLDLMVDGDAVSTTLDHK
jgi:hypothetical protein